MLEAAASSEGMSNVSRISGRRGMMVSSVRYGSAILGNAAGRLGSGAGRGDATRGWLSMVLQIGVEIRVRSESASTAVIRVSRKNSRHRF